MKGRKNGCPVNIRNWLVYILDISTNDFVRIYGLESLSYSVDSDTEEGSHSSDDWAEPYVTKRNASMSLEGRPIVDESTGARDPGQELLNEYARLVGCEGDATLKFIDPYGHATVADYIVTSVSEDADDSEQSVSWDLEQVGEAEILPYVQLTAISTAIAGTAATTLAMSVGDAAKVVTVNFTPDDASNKRFRVGSNKRSVAAVTNVTEDGFSVVPMSAGTANIVVTSVNGAKTATLVVTVS